MPDRLEQIRKAYRNNKGLTGRTIAWMIGEIKTRQSEIEKLRTERTQLLHALKFTRSSPDNPSAHS